VLNVYLLLFLRSLDNIFDALAVVPSLLLYETNNNLSDTDNYLSSLNNKSRTLVELLAYL